MTIYQPRTDNVSDAVMAAADLLDWAEGLKARRPWLMRGRAIWCRETTAFSARRKYGAGHTLRSNGIAKYEFRNADLPPMRISDVLDRSADPKNWLGKVEEYASPKRNDRKKWPGYKACGGPQRRMQGSGRGCEKTLVNGIPEAIIYELLLGITRWNRRSRRRHSPRAVRSYREAAGKPTLVPA